MVNGDDRLDAMGEKCVHEPAVKPEPCPIDGCFAVRLHAVPGDGEPVCPHAQVRHEGDVGLHAVVVVAGYVARVAVKSAAGAVAKCVPDRRCPAVLVNCPLDLVCRSGHTPKEALGKDELVCHGRVLSLVALRGRGHVPTGLSAHENPSEPSRGRRGYEEKPVHEDQQAGRQQPP